ncbi:MAG: tryptophan synthase subunit alpha [Aeromicrobium sp.]|uniref:tryptophan synthase subunit alpha n=1 Tax=Aeromicrobium sp. TaxID=1871063 RepID=UPI0039E3273E
MSAVGDLFARTRSENRAALVGYLPAGFPSVDASIRAIATMVENGVDLVEVGLPYSDPVMDGPTIQAAAETALQAGTRVDDVFEVVGATAALGVPTVVMTYWNPVERRGVDRFAGDLAAVGGAGLITPDLIPDEAAEWDRASRENGLDRIYLVAPSSTDERLELTAEAASGFIYATAVMGVTGQREQTSSLAPELVARLRRVTDKPVGVGLGVSNGRQAAEVAAFADAVIVGSALVRCLLDAPDEQAGLAALATLTRDLRTGMER